MPTHPRLARRGQTFYLRAAVPAALRPTLGKREITRSLKTRDPREALRRVRIESVRVDEQFEAARRQQLREHEPPQPDLSEEQLRELKAVYYRHLLEQDEEIRLAGFHDPDEPEETLPEHPRDTFEEHEEGSEDLASHARRGYARGKADPFIRSEAEDLLDWDGVDIRLASGSPGWPRLYRAVQEALIEAGDAIAERNKGRVVRTPEAPVIRQAPPPGPLLSELIEERIAEQQRSGVSAKILHDYRTWLGYLIEIAGDRSIGSYTREDGRRFKATISRLPGNWAKKKGLKGLGVVKASEKAARLEMEPMSVATVNKALSRVGAFWNWAEKHFDDVTRNIVQGQAIAERTSARDQRQPFTTDDLTRIFSAPTYKGCDGERRWAYPGTEVLDNLARFWVPLLGLFTGARLNELCQLRPEDVVIEKGIPCLRITDEAPWQTLKTASSRRLIPLHPRLLSLGFLAFVEGKRGRERLFAELQPDAFGYLSDAFSKHFARFLKSVGVKRPKVSFHSFRHCFEDACRAAGVERGLMDALQGHSEGGMAARYGQGFPVERLAEAVRSIDYPEVTLWRGGERF